LTINDCTISDNQATTSGGAGITDAMGGTLTINDSTISGNIHTSADGVEVAGGIVVLGHIAGPELILTNSTISNNSIASNKENTAGGIYNREYEVIMTNSTIANNSGARGVGGYGQMNSSNIYIKNTIIANNTSTDGTADYYSKGTTNNNGYNIIETQNDSNFENGVKGCFVGSGTYNLSTTLADNDTTNGTQTLALFAGSDAINNGNATANEGITPPASDQRGISRVDTIDIGAYEFTDFTAPRITSISSNKPNGSYTVGEVIDIDVVFGEEVTSTGNVTVTLETGDTDRTCTFSISGSSTGSCNYTVQAGDTSSDLDASISGTIKDAAENTLVNFTPGTTLATNKDLVIDTTNPNRSSLFPIDNATSVTTTVDLLINFDEIVATSSGSIMIYKTDDDSLVETIDISGAMLSGYGTDSFTIDPSTILTQETGYYVIAEATVFDDLAGNSFAGITASTTWNFTTLDTPDCPVIDNAATYNAYPTCGVATCNDGYNLSEGACVAQGGGGAPSLPPATGSGEDSSDIGMGQTTGIGTVDSKGTNVLGYINSKANFKTVVSNHSSHKSEDHSLEIINLDLFKNIVTLQIYSEPQIIMLALDSSSAVDLDRDGINDIEVKFEDVYVNRAEITIKSLLGNTEEESVESEEVVVEEDIVEEESTEPEEEKKEEIESSAKDKFLNKFNFIKDLFFGLFSNDVKELQIFLNQNNFPLAETNYGSPGNETTFFGPLTRAALIRFQKANNILPSIGYFGPITRKFIKSK